MRMKGLGTNSWASGLNLKAGLGGVSLLRDAGAVDGVGVNF